MGDYNEDEYSDDFEEESGVHQASKLTSLVNIDTGIDTVTAERHHVSTETKPATKRKSKGTRMSLTQKQKRGSSFSRTGGHPSKKGSSGLSPGAREVSACKHTIMKLQNRIADVQRELDESRKENRILNRLKIRYERDLNRYQAQEGELPQLLSRHSEEVRVLREHLKRSLHNSQTYQKQMKEYREELLKLGNQKKKLEEIAERKNLLGREKLTHQLQLATNLLREKDTKITELERKVELTSKSHVTEMRALIKRNRSLSVEAEELREVSQRVHSKLKEKEKNLDVMNMYTQRFTKQLVVNSVTTDQLIQTQITCPASKSMSVHIAPGSADCTSLYSHYQAKLTQTDICLNPASTNQTLKVVSSWQKIVDSKSMANKAVQTDDGEVNNGTINQSAVNLLPSKATASSVLPSDDSHTKLHTGSQFPTAVSGGRVMNGGGLAKTTHNSTLNGAAYDTSGSRGGVQGELTGVGRVVNSEEKRFGRFEDEKRKKEELLAKLRAIDGVKNPPESQPIQSTAVKGSVDLTTDNNPGVDYKRGSIEALAHQSHAIKGSIQGSERHSNNENDHTHSVEYENQPLQPGSLSQESNVSAIGSQSHYHTQHTPSVPGSQPSHLNNGVSAHSNQPVGSSTLFRGGNLGGALLDNRSTDSTGPSSNALKLEYGVSKSQVTSSQTTGAHFGTSDNQRSKESSLFAGGQLTKGIADLSSLQNRENRSTVSDHFQGTITSTAAETRQQPKNSGKFMPVAQRENSQKTVSSKTSSSGQSWPDPIQNMHSGKPAYATEHDPFGSKHAAYMSTLKRTSTESREYKPLHGRRAGNTSFEKEGSLSSEIEKISENHPGSRSPSSQNFLPRRESESYPWEVAIDVHKKEPAEVTTKASEFSAKRKREFRGQTSGLLPLRPKKTSIEMVMGESMPGSVGVSEPDDLEEVVL